MSEINRKKDMIFNYEENKATEDQEQIPTLNTDEKLIPIKVESADVVEYKPRIFLSENE